MVLVMSNGMRTVPEALFMEFFCKRLYLDLIANELDLCGADPKTVFEEFKRLKAFAVDLGFAVLPVGITPPDPDRAFSGVSDGAV